MFEFKKERETKIHRYRDRETLKKSRDINMKKER